MKPIISVENLSKKYLINHQKTERYVALRDVLTQKATNIANKLIHPFSKSAPDNTQEEFWALKDINFDIQPGDKVGIIGRNGAGKSTLLKILSRITEPTSGRITIRGRVASLLEVGTGFHPELTGRENIFLNGAILGMSKAEIRKKFDEIVSFAEVEKFLDTPVKHYSSGMYVRLAFAVAAHLEPEILIVDEVLAVGDAQFQKKCMGKMQDVGKEGRTVLFVSHNMTAIKTLCNHAVSLHNGRIVSLGAVNGVINDYLNKGLHNTTERVWSDQDKIAGNQYIRLYSLKVVAEEKAPQHFNITTAFFIEFTYSLLVEEALFYIGIHFKTLAGECIFVSALPPELLDRGTYRSVCHIPGNLLNTGSYTIHAYFVRNGSDVLFEIENPLVFEVQDVERPEGAWIGEIPGAVRPKLNWDTIHCQNL